MASLNDLLVTSKTTLSQDELNRRYRAIHDRLAALEAFSPEWEAEVNALREVGLARIDDALIPAFEQALAIGDIGAFFTTTSESTVTAGEGEKTFVIPSAVRKLFAPTAVLRARAQDASGILLYGDLVSYDREDGALVIDVSNVIGSGSASAWQISATAPYDIDHAADQNNPHGVTAAQIGAPTEVEMAAAIAVHAEQTDNPHGVTAAQVGALSAETVEDALELRALKAQNLGDLPSHVNARGNIKATGNLFVVTALASSGTHTLNGQTRLVMVTIVGGGGGSGATLGGGSLPRCAGGGGGGEVAMLRQVVSGGEAATVVIGAGGAAGLAGGPIKGANGGTSNFTCAGVSVTASGGEGGEADGGGVERRDGGLGGSGGSGGFFRTSGERGGHGNPGSVHAGHGGASGFSYGASRSSSALTFSGGIPGALYGGGAAGALHLTNGAPLNGAPGASGVCIIMEYR